MSIDSSKFNWKIFILGIIIGLIIFAIINYFIQDKKVATNEQVIQPVVFNISPQDHIKGNYNAPIDLVVFNDYTCKYCQEYALELEKIFQQNPNKVRIIWKHFPLNQNYYTAAIAAECADEQNKFWEYSHELYSNKDKYTNEFYLNTATDLNLDLAEFSTCLTSDKYQAKIQADYYEGIMKGVLGAPATFINGNYIPGVIPLDKLQQLIDKLNQ